MKKLLSLPENLVNQFHQLEQVTKQEYFCASDPAGTKVGSGGGTSWLFYQNWKTENPEMSFSDWLAKDQRIIIHAGGQSRRLPSYATAGKILTPIPVFRYERGQKLDQSLMDLQLPLYEKIMTHAPAGVNTLIASGDTFIRANDKIEKLPEADVICYGLWVEPSLATNHGVYVCDREYPHELLYMLQKPSSEIIRGLAVSKLFLMDIGIWLLSDKAVKLLMKKSGFDAEQPAADWTPSFYDLYGQFGLNLGSQAENADPELNALSVAILPLPGGEFYHYGTSRELISSTLAVQNRVKDQRSIWTKNVKPHPAMFIQNAVVEVPLTSDHSELWIENSHVGKGWKLAQQHILTGIPENNWTMDLQAKTCIDLVTVGETTTAVRPYGFSDKFSGKVADKSTLWMGISLPEWFFQHDVTLEDAGILPDTDIQEAALFPLIKDVEQMGRMLNWMIQANGDDEMKALWLSSERLSAAGISAKANLFRLYEQRKAFRIQNWPVLAKNYQRSVFYQVNLDEAAKDYAENNIELPASLSEQESAITRLHDYMFRSRVAQYAGKNPEPDEQKAFALLRESLIQSLKGDKVIPQLNIFPDQIVWGRSPVRIDLAGGWSDTPPFCLMSGGSVLNMAIELNGQPPLQVYIKPCEEYKIILRSIDLGAREDVKTFEELADYQKVGSPFSIPKAALCLAGFGPVFSKLVKGSLEEQLKAFGCGIEISLLAAIPKGSGLGTSSILAATVLGALSDFCGLNWDKNEICNRTLVLEQLLTTGGGWQDQYGGVFPGIKLLETRSGLYQSPTVRWTPDYLFTRPEYRECMLLYYTGITRTAKNILSEIVRGMFLNSTRHLAILNEIKAHAQTTFEALQTGSYEHFAQQVSMTWQQKQDLDPGTNPPAIQGIINQIKDLCLAYKLPGAGGGGYMFIMAKDPEAAGKIKQILTLNPPNKSARFVDISLSNNGFQSSRS
ncbi:galactokinase/mevalonate kinase-like predicted kinase [Mangrovibacterium diazotrophicum]|uniref:Galactokinase/mevalonate kinase-like predicted kinase n=2 Tax=Mangrovibacterium diazotrophicum TaxID=1261403 RepID=A0A419VUE7_9BACT|nr:galactokinase/mevalonate kinase-like predicted kinase [Mangrovibacterium diazotrophicum]